MAIPTVLGLTLLDLVLPGRNGLLRRLGLGFLFGSAILASLILSFEQVLGVWLGSPDILVAVGLCSLMVLAWRALRAEHQHSFRLAKIHVLASIGLAGLVCLLALESVSVPPTDWDGVMTWLPLARSIAADRAVHPSALLDATVSFANPRYPPAVPLLNAILVPALGADIYDERNLRLLSIGFLCGFLAVVYSLAEDLGTPASGRIGVCLALSIQMVVTERKGGALGEYADLPLAAFVGLLVLLILENRARWPLFVVIAAVATTKMEGLPIAATIVCLLLVVGMLARPRRLRFAMSAVGAVFVAGALRFAWQEPIPTRDMHGYSLSALAQWSACWRHLSEAIPLIAERMLPNHRWGLLWFFSALAAVWLARRRSHDPGALVLLGSMFAPPAIGVLAYAVHPFPGVLVPVTWDRLLLQGSASAFALTAAFLSRMSEVAGFAPLLRRRATRLSGESDGD